MDFYTNCVIDPFRRSCAEALARCLNSMNEKFFLFSSVCYDDCAVECDKAMQRIDALQGPEEKIVSSKYNISQEVVRLIKRRLRDFGTDANEEMEAELAAVQNNLLDEFLKTLEAKVSTDVSELFLRTELYADAYIMYQGSRIPESTTKVVDLLARMAGSRSTSINLMAKPVFKYDVCEGLNAEAINTVVENISDAAHDIVTKGQLELAAKLDALKHSYAERVATYVTDSMAVKIGDKC